MQMYAILFISFKTHVVVVFFVLSYYTNPVKTPEYDYDSAQFPYKLVEGNHWKLQSQSSSETEIKDKQSQYPFFDAPSELSSGQNQFSTFSANSKPSGYPQPSISWVREKSKNKLRE